MLEADDQGVAAEDEPVVRQRGAAPRVDLDALRAFTEVSEALVEGRPLDDALRLVALKLCELVGVRRCSVFLRDAESGAFQGRVGYDGGVIDAEVRRHLAGLPADRLTAEVLRTRRPAQVRDARRDPRPVRSVLQAWGVRSILAVPMARGRDVEGIIFLDDVDRAHVFSDTEQSVAVTFANLAATAVAQSAMADELRAAAELAQARNEVLRRAFAAEERMTAMLVDGPDLRSVAGAVAELSGRACVVSSVGHDIVVTAPAGSASAAFPDREDLEDPAIAEALEQVRHKRAGIVGPFPHAGVEQRHLVARVDARGEHWGYLVLTEDAHRLGELDVLIARQAAGLAAIALTAERRSRLLRADEAQALIGELVRGGADPEVVRRRARRLDVDLTRPHVLVAVRDGQLEPEAIAGEVARDRGLVMGDTALLLIEVPAGVPRRGAVRELCSTLGRLLAGTGASASVSTVCDAVDQYPIAHRELVGFEAVLAEQRAAGGVARAVQTAPTVRTMLAGREEVFADRLIEDALGPLLDAGRPRRAALLQTAQVFLQSGRSTLQTAQTLGVHVNTVRYRLKRVLELTELDLLFDAEDQLTAELAVAAARLHGRL